MMSYYSRLTAVRTYVSKLFLVGLASSTPAIASSYNCTNHQSGEKYTSSQKVPGDKCTEVKDRTAKFKPSDSDYPAGFKAELAEAVREAQANRAAEALTGPRAVNPAIGMTSEIALTSSWGKPRSINRITTAEGVIEYWHYRNGMLRFDGGRLTSISEY